MAARAELARLRPSKVCCARAELGGMLRAGGSLRLGGENRLTVAVETEHPEVARKALLLFRRVAGLPAEVVVEEHGPLRRRIYQVRLVPGPEARRLLADLEILTPEGGIGVDVPASLVRGDCCRAAFLRGVYLVSGSVCDPRGSGYHLEMVVSNEEFAHGLYYLLRLAKFKVHQARRKGREVVYLKDADDIAAFLGLIGAHTALLELEGIRVVKEVRGGVNRLVNAETANVEKSVAAAVEQIRWIEVIREKIGLERLPKALREMALVRLAHPEASLAELGQLLARPISKSAVNHRLRRLRRLAEEMTEEG
ncbi:MAG: DNA-binding protein WhiA [Firmicutes bacterium]|nr:DNA-binding protein WhiA [Bacillota bacterium]